MIKADIHLNNYLLHMENVLDGRFRVDGIQVFRSIDVPCRCKDCMESFLHGYGVARWYLFCKTN